jgi:thymidine kinase
MGAGKTLDLLKVSYNYEENNENILVFTSSIDNRYGENIIKSRVGLSRPAISIDSDFNIFEYVKSHNNNIKSVIVDESQFLTKNHIHQLSDVVDILDIPVICYGLRSDYRLEPFEGSKYLMTIADTIEEIKTICSNCKSKKATVNARFEDGVIVTDGEQIKIGGNETYRPLCRKCFKSLISNRL